VTLYDVQVMQGILKDEELEKTGLWENFVKTETLE
jgi:hypothetical protein